jgi:hypothetical protein
MTCPVCCRPASGTVAGREAFCTKHGEMMAIGAENLRLHAEHGGCYEGCGCVTVASTDDLDQALGLAPAAPGQEGDGR